MRPVDPERDVVDSGYALVAAVAAVAVFAYMAFQAMSAGQGAVAIAGGRLSQARLTAAADAGVALAIHGLAVSDRGARWSIDGRVRHVDFDGVDLAIVVEDERGKASLSGLDNPQARALFSGAGAAGEQLDNLVAEFRDWQNDPAAGGDLGGLSLPEADGRSVRHGPFRTVGELAALQDMTPAIFAKIAPFTTVFFEDTGPFDPEHAGPLAKGAMSADANTNADQVDGETETAAVRPEEDLAGAESLVGDPLTIRVIARAPDGSRAHRMEIVEFTGDPRQPYWVRYAE